MDDGGRMQVTEVRASPREAKGWGLNLSGVHAIVSADLSLVGSWGLRPPPWLKPLPTPVVPSPDPPAARCVSTGSPSSPSLPFSPSSLLLPFLPAPAFEVRDALDQKRDILEEVNPSFPSYCGISDAVVAVRLLASRLALSLLVNSRTPIPSADM
ncbi:uncharacterized protein FIBRA_02356 [Fibroporia radiculosa]|uniref:Uncharacterized protein n=1 Tax=Fibroporia radiculosa TaxID=599839 RepID=J4I906_9APHY|nr:uncharacterized protein FIBRA_02356 [Fibroporia radiculosa]CCM00326.1 predicted protein [Fibroporia radiculosa]